MFDTTVCGAFINKQTNNPAGEAAVAHRIVVGAIARRAQPRLLVGSDIAKALGNYDDKIGYS